MRYYKLMDRQGRSFLGVEQTEGLVSVISSMNTFEQLVQLADLFEKDIDELANMVLQTKRVLRCELEELKDASSELRLCRPLDPPEIWAAGVTYRVSKEERERESDFAAEAYARVYQAVRPEVYLKATLSRCVGPFEDIGIRGDSEWNVAEPELAVVLYKGKIIGYTVGNDVCSRSIEGENPLYLPQAKIYNRCCAIGPCIASKKTILDPHKLVISCTILRKGEEIFRGQISTAEMVRTCEELTSFVLKHNVVPDFMVVLTGTGIIPPPEFTLQPEDIVRITIEHIGTLENKVVQV